MKIAFGTDGWRALMRDLSPDGEFTEENVAWVSQALADYWKRQGFTGTGPIIGYDRRKNSAEMAQLVAEVLAGNGFLPLLSSQFCPTPTVSWMVKERGAIGGVMVTASHNPWQWNGIKFKESYGGSASPEYTAGVEALLAENEGRKVKRSRFAPISSFDPGLDYLAQLSRLIDIPRIRGTGLKALYDPLYGAGSGFLKRLLPDHIHEIHTAADYRFGGLNPEPIAANLHELMEQVKNGDYLVGLATDGDADRIGAVDERGRYITSHQFFALLLKYLVEKKGLRGPIVKSVSTTKMLDILGEKYGLHVYETPIGFKHICKKFVEAKALLGGEESGGIGFGPHVYERDGLLNALFLMEMIIDYDKTPSDLIRALEHELGPFAFLRLDLHLEGTMREQAERALAKPSPDSLAGKRVARVQTIDGCKLHFADQSWLLLRLSGTEPLLRIYAEARSDEEVRALVEAGKDYLFG